MNRAFMGWLFFVLILISSPISRAHQIAGCQLPPSRAEARNDNMFTEEQENELGKIVNYQAQQSLRTIEDPDLTAYLQRVGDNLVASLPPTNLSFHFYLVDLPEANAFALPGGHVYVSRKLVAFFRSEDEMAAVLSHELGHIISHQGATAISRAMRSVLKIDHIETDEIFDRYNELLENWRRKEHFGNSSEDEHQLEADRMGVYALARAGYNPLVISEFFDRFAETKGKTGSWFSDLFGSASPNSLRLREMVREVSSLPAGCLKPARKISSADFQRWQSTVIAYRGIGHKESLHGVVFRKKIQPSLRADLDQLRVSPDGKYFLAQDEGSIVVFHRETMQPVFHIDAENAHLAQFAPDSRHISFYTSGLASSPRVEVWDIEGQTQETHEVYEHNGCEQTALSSDGHYFVCIALSEQHFAGPMFDLRVRDVDSGELAFEKKSFFTGDRLSLLSKVVGAIRSGAADIPVAELLFAPDNRYLLVGRNNVAMAIDLSKASLITLDQNVKRIMRVQFAFLDANRLIGVEQDGHAQIVNFLDGRILADRLEVGLTTLRAAANPRYLVVGAVKDFSAGVFDIEANKIPIISKTKAIDIYGDVLLREKIDGRIAALSVNDGKELAVTPMPDTRLGELKASAQSRDMTFLALSGRSRGAVWNLKSDNRLLYLRGFTGGYFDATNTLCTIFPRQGETKRSVAVADLNAPNFRTREVEENVHSSQFGRFLVIRRPDKKDDYRENVTFEVRDICTDAVLWSRQFQKGVPRTFMHGDSLVFIRSLADDEAKAAIWEDAQLQQRERELRQRVGVLYLELLESATGHIRSKLLIDTGNGSFLPTSVFFTKDRLFIHDNHERLLVYTLDGKLVGRVFGLGASISPDGKYLLVYNSRGRLTAFDTDSLEQREQLDFTEAVSLLAFGADPTILTIVTSDQTLYRIDLTLLKPAQSAHQ